MSLPAGIQVCTVTFGGAVDFGGTGLSDKISAAPSKDVIWKNGPHRLGGPSFPLTASVDASSVGSLQLPCVDQPGFKDDTGANITGWYYTLVLTLSRVTGGAQETVQKLFSPVMGQTTVAFDDIPSTTAQPATAVAATPVTSVNGQTGDVVIAGGGVTIDDTTTSPSKVYSSSKTASAIAAAAAGLDDVLGFANLAAFPATGSAGTIYETFDTNFLYRWSGSSYVQVGGGSSSGGTLAAMAPGGVFTVEKLGSNWQYAGATVTTRPTSRTDVKMLSTSTDGTVPPFALAGFDLAFTVPS